MGDASRDDLDRLRRAADAPGPPAPGRAGGGRPFVGRVAAPGATIAVGKYFLVHPTPVLGAETAGAAGTPSPLASTVPVLLLGPGVPAVGNDVVCRRVPDRWVAEFPAARGTYVITGHIPGCFCVDIPGTLTMTSGDPSCNYRMFQSCTLQWGPTPPVFASLSLGVDSFLSVESFPDPIAGGALFHYFLICYHNEFTLTRVYPESPYGSPYRDGILYTWLLGGSGNDCFPFRLENGQAYPGSDYTCSVIIDP